MNLQPVRVLLLSQSNELSMSIKKSIAVNGAGLQLSTIPKVSLADREITETRPDIILLDLNEFDFKKAVDYYDTVLTYHIPLLSIIPSEFNKGARKFINPGLSDYFISCDENVTDIVHNIRSVLYINKLYNKSLKNADLENEVHNLKKEKDFFLKELYHRINNMLQIVCSLLNLDVQTLNGKNGYCFKMSSISRIRSMAQIYSIFLQSQASGNIDIDKFISWLLKEKCRIYKVPWSLVNLNMDAEPIILKQEKVFVIGLIIDEIVTNSIVHGYKGSKSGGLNITVNIKQENGNTLLTIKDNGKGFPDKFIIEDEAFSGLKLVQFLVEYQLKGEVKFFNEQGGVVQVSFPA